MRRRLGVDRFVSLPRVAAVGLIGSLAAACSSETVRLSDPFSNPFSTAQGTRPASDPMPTGSITPAAPASAVVSQPLAPIASAPGQAAGAAAAVVSPRAPLAAAPLAAAPATPRLASAASGPAGWSAQGGTAVTVGQGESLNVIANRYNVPPAAILQANGLSGAGQVAPGSRLVIPVYNAAGPGAPAAVRAPQASPVQPIKAAKPAATPRPLAAKVPVAPAKTVEARPVSETRKAVEAKKPQELKKPAATQAAARPVEPVRATAEPKARVRPGMNAASKAEAVNVADKAPVPVSQPDPAKATKPVQAKAAEPKAAGPKLADVKAAEPKKQVAASPVEAPKAPVKDPEGTASLPTQPQAPAADFRWPAKGRVIQGFGGGSGNEGINIAVPEGTPVKAAGDGVVAYAGEELKGYGKLVLIRHDNGYVSAYAHNGELNVKRGEAVRRGQAIAKSGQTGNVNAPQLHFEIRKGSTPVDPMPYLGGS